MLIGITLPHIPLLRRKSRLAYLRQYATAIVEEFGSRGIIMTDSADLAQYYTSGLHYKFARIYCELNKYTLDLSSWIRVIEDEWTDIIPKDITDCHSDSMYSYICPRIVLSKSPLFGNTPVEEAWPLEYVPTLVGDLIVRAEEIEAVNQKARQPEFLHEFRVARSERCMANQSAFNATRKFRTA